MQTPEQTLHERERLVPRQRLAAGAAAAPPRPRRALRLRLPDPAEERRQVARRPERHRGRLHRPARLVRGLPAGRRLDRARPDLGPARRRRPHPARLLARAVVGARRSPARSTSARRRSSTRCRCARVWEAPRVTLPYTDAQWEAIEALGHAGRRRPARRRRPPHAWAASRRSCRSTIATAREWNTDGARPDQAGLSARR